MSCEELYLSNASKTANVSKSISIPNEEFSDDTTPSVARKFLNDVKSTIVTLQRVVKQKMTLDIHNWLSSVHQEIHKIVKDEIFLIVNQVDARVQNFEIQFLKEATKFVRDFQSLAKEVDESLAKNKALEWEIERLLRAVENEYAKLWNDWYKKCKECKYDKISYDKAYNDMQQKIKRLQAHLGDQKGRSKDTPCVSDTLDPLPQKLENENVELEINPFKNSREEKSVPNNPIKASVRTNPITVPQPHVITKKVVNSDSNGLSSTGVKITTKTRKPQHRSNTKNDRVPSAFKSSHIKNKEVEREEHLRNLLLSKNKKHISSECNNIKLAIRNDKFEIVCAICKQCLITANHACVLNYMNGMNSHGKKQKENVSNITYQTKHKPQVWKLKNVGSHKRLASTGRIFDLCGKLISSSDSGCYPNMFVVRRLGLFQAYDRESKSSHQLPLEVFRNHLEVAFRRNTCFVRNLEVVDLLKGNRTTNLYTINLHDMASASPICLMARATSTKSWLWHQRLSHLNFDTINDLAKNDLVTGLPKFKYHKEHLYPSREQGKRKRAYHPPKLVPNSKQRLVLLHMDLCGPMRIASINGKLYVLVIVDDYSRYTWVVFLRSKDETPLEIKIFLKKITVLLQAPVIIIRTDNDTEFKNQVLQEYINSVGISHQASSISIATVCYTQNCFIIHRRFDKTSYELINGIKQDISFLYVFGALCYPKNDCKDIGKLGLNLPYAPSTITTQQPTKGELDLLFEAMYDDHVDGQPSAAPRTILAAQAPQYVDELETQQHVQHQPASIADNVPNAMYDDNTFVNPFATPSTSAAESSSLQYVDPSNMHTFYQPYPHEYQ
ncbi:retrovirus-related pol polyprotein from transposon TNT 1-94 [Tanacetum coccineum]|uniref:Retrovirus-related pol polyprotein from transposon TNT 1-94 n=1 Tax=Tanacetum coccineum TaxID=301880 RepID=A0ABQ5A8R1_9ASTR